MARPTDRSVEHVDGRRRRLLGTALLVLAPLPVAAAESWQLLTPDEASRDDAAPQVPAPPDLPPPPSIDLLRPDISQPIRNPVTIEVQFSPTPGRSIDMQTFNATYGRLGINITRRLLEHATTTANGLAAEGVVLPTGSHRVSISVADTSGKTASRTFQFTIAA